MNDNLPPLPDPELDCHGATTIYSGEYFTADQMRAYAVNAMTGGGKSWVINSGSNISERVGKAIHYLLQFDPHIPDDYTLAEMCGDVMIPRGIEGERLIQPLPRAHSAGGVAAVRKDHIDSDNATLYLDGDIAIARFHNIQDAEAFAAAYNATA